MRLLAAVLLGSTLFGCALSIAVDAIDEMALAGAIVGSGQQGDLSATRGGLAARIRQSCMVAAVYPRD